MNGRATHIGGLTMTVGRLARLANVSVRTLHHYDEIGVLKPSQRSTAGYRRYGSEDLQHLQLILFYRELGFGLTDIRRIVLDPGFDRHTALQAQRELLASKARQTSEMLTAIDAAISALEKGIQMNADEMFEVFGDFDPRQYQAEVERRWGDSGAYRESQRRAARYSRDDWQRMGAEAAATEEALAAKLVGGAQAGSAEVMELAERHRLHIDRWFYPCSYEIQIGLASAYVDDERFRRHYDERQAGLAEFLHDAILANAARAGLVVDS